MTDEKQPEDHEGLVMIEGVGGREPWPPAAVFALIGIPLLAVFTALATWWGVDHIEDQLTDEARADFAANGLDPDDYEIDFDYRDGDARGPLPAGVSERQAEDYVDHRLLNDFDVHATAGVVEDTVEPEPEDDEVVVVGTDVDVELVDGRIVLRGTVPSEAHRQALLDAAAEVVGVENVVDELTVVAGEPTDGADARIAALAAAIATAGADDALSFALSDSSLDVSGSISEARATALRDAVDGARLDGSVALDVIALGSTDVEAVYDGDAITLTGTVLSEAQRDELIAAAEAVVGADNVVDELVVLDAEARADGADGRVDDMADAIRSLGDASAGSATMTDDGVELIVSGPADDEVADAEAINELQVELDALAAEIRENVVFATGSDVLDGGATATLDKVVDAMTRHPLPVVEIAGHTDSTGDPDANRALSAARAQSVVDYLVGQGIEAARLQSRGAGADEPIADNDTAEGRAQNRRVELTAAADFGA